jgi:ATP-binding cassette subfamily B protein
MDRATGRRWLSPRELLKEVYVHTASVPAAEWRAWAGSDAFLSVLRRRLADPGLSSNTISRLIEVALADAGWRSMAALDAAARMVHSIVLSGGLGRGRSAASVIEMVFERARSESSGVAQTSVCDGSQVKTCATGEVEIIPETYWIVRPAPPTPDGHEQVLMRGAVLMSVMGRRRAEDGPGAASGPPLPPELVAALEEEPSHPGRQLLGFLRADGVATPGVLLAALALAAGGLVVEALLFRVLFDLGSKLGVLQQRLGAMAALVVFSGALVGLELPLASTLLRYGRRLEARLRLAFLEKIPRLGDRYFQSRLISDMAERCHSAQVLRILPTLGGQFVRLIFELALTTAGLIWLDPAGAPVALTVAAVVVMLPLAMQTRLTERDLRVRSHNAALGRFYLDALLGLVPIRTHGAERAVRREHESLLVEWTGAGLGFLRAAVAVEAVQSVTGFGLAAWLLFDHLSRSGEVGGVLLLVYWALGLPMLGQQIGLLAQQYPMHRNVTLRALEPLGAPEEMADGGWPMAELDLHGAGNPKSEIRNPKQIQNPKSKIQNPPSAIEIVLENVSVRAGGNMILDEVNLDIEAGSHIAIVGPSGAGKSSLVGLLLGWHRAATGRTFVDGRPLDSQRLEALRQETAWVDPTVQLWNRSLLENLRYGAPTGPAMPVRSVIDAADLRRVLEKLPDGLQTSLGDGGALVSGGEGQRVRLGRALGRSGVRLVILDEPFRGLGREQRRELMARARELWREATLICITHDVGDTQGFERVLVVERGRIVEDGAPFELAEQPDSRYRNLLEAEQAVRMGLWSSAEWRHLQMAEGQLLEQEWEAVLWKN